MGEEVIYMEKPRPQSFFRAEITAALPLLASKETKMRMIYHDMELEEEYIVTTIYQMLLGNQ